MTPVDLGHTELDRFVDFGHNEAERCVDFGHIVAAEIKVAFVLGFDAVCHNLVVYIVFVVGGDTLFAVGNRTGNGAITAPSVVAVVDAAANNIAGHLVGALVSFSCSQIVVYTSHFLASGGWAVF